MRFGRFPFDSSSHCALKRQLVKTPAACGFSCHNLTRVGNNDGIDAPSSSAKLDGVWAGGARWERNAEEDVPARNPAVNRVAEEDFGKWGSLTIPDELRESVSFPPRPRHPPTSRIGRDEAVHRDRGVARSSSGLVLGMLLFVVHGDDPVDIDTSSKAVVTCRPGFGRSFFVESLYSGCVLSELM